ncbi:Tad domain-containing protein [Alteraurantiacibacter aestuarii]|uniref:Tad domain-containing protein n=1 Tax=Alteraurantiacibacter aestuarii TaxID=650004 RepID=UPI0031E04F30
MLVALGMPVLIGGAGLGVDLAQWYMWKRELQYAVDQAAVAGAWARADSATESSYVTRAQQEFNANLSVIEDFTVSPTIALANWAGGSNNSVAVSATAGKALPFSNFLTGRQATIYAYAQASFNEGTTFTSCLIAVDDDEDGAITIGGNASLTAGCGMAALSDDPNAIIANGNPTVQAGWILARGGIDDWFDTNTDDVIMENMDGLYDPFEHLTPPNPTESQVARTYSCSSTAGSTIADVREATTVNYDYFKGSNKSNATPYIYGSPKPDTTSSDFTYGQAVSSSTQAGSVTSTSAAWTQVSGSGSNKIWERRTTTITRTYSNVTTSGGTLAGSLSPGTYTNIHVGCRTTFATGVYIIDGGGIDITGQYEVTGSNVMFVLKNGAYIKIRGGADVNLTAIQASDLIARGVAAEDANKLAGMLVFEDRQSGGSSRNDINGNSNTVLNGTIYFPVSNVTFSGTASVTSQCLMIAANTITLTGTTDMSTFCPSGSSEDTTVANIAAKVRLVA